MTAIPVPGPIVVMEGGDAGASSPTRYVGLMTRLIAAVIDAAIVDGVAVVVGLGASLVGSILHLPSWLKTVLLAIGAAAYVVWVVGYFVVFWSTTGQTPGDRVMQFRVVTTDEERLKPRRALLRCGAVVIAALPLFAGFFLILFDSRRRGLHDRIARTLVIEAPGTSVVAGLRLRRERAPAPDQANDSQAVTPIG